MDITIDRAIAKAQFIKTKRAEVRLRYSLIGDAEIARSLPEWLEEFERRALDTVPVVFDGTQDGPSVGA